MVKVRKAVFPVGGFGTRFLPATKAMPKEMLPVVDKPLIQYAVEEAAAAGITDMIFVTGRHKRAIEDHFDTHPEIESALEAQGKLELLNAVRMSLPAGTNCIFIRQPEPLGLGHAVLCAQPAVGNEPFAVLLADDLLIAERSVTAQLVDEFHRLAASVIGVQDVPREHTRRYGIVDVGMNDSITSLVQSIVEKPAPEDAPSTLGVVGRYVLSGAIFEHLHRIGRGSGGEIQLTDAIACLMSEQAVHAHRYIGRRFDCGSKAGMWAANVLLGLHHPEILDTVEATLSEAQALISSRPQS
jgi:UTP--glucose-1-phosphate uridylyltransferase